MGKVTKLGDHQFKARINTYMPFHRDSILSYCLIVVVAERNTLRFAYTGGKHEL